MIFITVKCDRSIDNVRSIESCELSVSGEHEISNSQKMFIPLATKYNDGYFFHSPGKLKFSSRTYNLLTIQESDYFFSTRFTIFAKKNYSS